MFDELLLVFIGPADFSETMMVDGKEVNAIFNHEPITDSGLGVAVVNTGPRIIVTEDDLPENMKSMIAIIRGKRYMMTETDFDGCGMVVVQLRAVHDKPTC